MTDAGGRGSLDLQPDPGSKRGEGALRLVIVDQHPLFRDCLAAVLAEDPRLEVVGKAGDDKEVLGKLAEARADVLLVGTGSSGDGVLDFIRIMGERFPRVRMLILGREESDGPILKYLEAGADGYLIRNQSLAELRSAIEIISRSREAGLDLF